MVGDYDPSNYWSPVSAGPKLAPGLVLVLVVVAEDVALCLLFSHLEDVSEIGDHLRTCPCVDDDHVRDHVSGGRHSRDGGCRCDDGGGGGGVDVFDVSDPSWNR